MPVGDRKWSESIKRDEPQSKSKEWVNKRKASYPGGGSRPSRLRHPVGVRGHVPKNRSIRNFAKKTKKFLWPRHGFVVPPYPP